MNNNFLKKNSNSIIIILVVLFVVIFVVAGYSLLSKNEDEDYDMYYVDENNNAENVETCDTKGKEVFNIRDNIFTFKEAQAVCKAHDAELATLEQMIDAYKKGANWCSYGWSEGQLALFPTQAGFWNELQKEQYRKNECGKPGVNGGYFENAEYKFGANCFGIKPEPKSSELEKNRNYRLGAQGVKVDQYKEQLDQFRISPFNYNNWSHAKK